jgi:hypothetical protein
LSSPPQALRSSTTRAARHKWKTIKKIGAEFKTSVSYRPEVISHSEVDEWTGDEC